MSKCPAMQKSTHSRPSTREAVESAIENAKSKDVPWTFFFPPVSMMGGSQDTEWRIGK